MNGIKQIASDILRIIPWLILWKILLIAITLAVVPLLPLHYPMTAFRDLSFTDFGLDLPYWVKIWGNFDGFYYLQISKQGYSSGIVPFFPLYPILIRTVHIITSLDRIIIGQMISFGSFFCAILIAKRLFVLDEKNKKHFLFFLLIICSFPTAFFYTATYNDSIFFLLATACIYCARRSWWISASIVGTLAVLARLNGLMLLPFLIIEYLSTAKKISIKTMLPFSLIPLAFIGYLIYIHITFGEWQFLFTAMSTWGQDKFILPPQVIWRYIKILILSFSPDTFVWWVALFEFAAVSFYMFLLFTGWRTIRLSYWIFFALSILIPWCTGTLQGMPRYGLHLYPMYLVLFTFLQKKSLTIRLFYFVTMIALQIVTLTLFTRGIFVS